ncbi:MAG: threonylcarbamoyl-AMP synthase [Rubrivivax sp.]|nr:threonylcarbamoyl-AMP synthase [Rubrivivax sp.]
MPVHPGDDPAALANAAQALCDGALVAFPTETVYGLGARADDDAAVAGIFAAKGRPKDHPLIVHVVDAGAAEHFSAQIGAAARRLMAAFWPGPLTLIVPRRAGVAAGAAGGQHSIGLRCPAHPVAQALLARAAALHVHGVAAPSANRFGRVSPTRAEHVVDEFGPSLRVLDGGSCAVGIESTIVDCTAEPPALLRPGGVPRAAIEAVLGQPLAAPGAHSPRASGTLASHYAPSARVQLMNAAGLHAALQQTPPAALAAVAVYSRQADIPSGLAAHRRMPDDAAAAAHDLFAVLRELDASGATQIWVERPPAEPAWDGVNDRLRRAAAA